MYFIDAFLLHIHAYLEMRHVYEYRSTSNKWNKNGAKYYYGTRVNA